MPLTLDARPGERVVGIGIDTAGLEAVRDGLDRFGDAYLRRVCSRGETAALPADPAERVARLGRLWAAKEAVTKSLAPADHEPWPWPHLDIDLDAGTADLVGRPGELARERGVTRVTVDGRSAAAVDRTAGRAATPEVRRAVTVVAIAWGKQDPRPSTAPRAPRRGGTDTTDEGHPMSTDLTAAVREILAAHAGLEADAATIATDADLYDAGMTSHASVNVMLAVEDELDVEFPDEMLQRDTFQSIDSIEAAVSRLQDE